MSDRAREVLAKTPARSARAPVGAQLDRHVRNTKSQQTKAVQRKANDMLRKIGAPAPTASKNPEGYKRDVGKAVRDAARSKVATDAKAAQRGVVVSKVEKTARVRAAKAKVADVAKDAKLARMNVEELAERDLARQREINSQWIPGNRPGDGLQSGTVTSATSPMGVNVTMAQKPVVATPVPLRRGSPIPSAGSMAMQMASGKQQGTLAPGTAVDDKKPWPIIIAASLVGLWFLKRKGA